jgi:hypothetical protein
MSGTAAVPPALVRAQQRLHRHPAGAPPQANSNRGGIPPDCGGNPPTVSEADRAAAGVKAYLAANVDLSAFSTLHGVLANEPDLSG